VHQRVGSKTAVGIPGVTKADRGAEFEDKLRQLIELTKRMGYRSGLERRVLFPRAAVLARPDRSGSAKQILGRKIHESTGTGNLKAVELILTRWIEEVRMARCPASDSAVFGKAAIRFVEEARNKRSIAE